jgi:hypothetical protein
MAADQLYAYKMQYAVLLQRVPKDKRPQYSAQIVKQVVGKDEAAKYTSWVLEMADQWLFDPDVIAEIDRLDHSPKTKEECLAMAWDFIVDPHKEDKDRIAAMRLYFEGIGLAGGRSNKDENTQSAAIDKMTQLVNAIRPRE